MCLPAQERNKGIKSTHLPKSPNYPLLITMKSSTVSAAVTVAGLASLVKAQVPGFDISGYQETTDFKKAYADGDRFVIIKVRSLVLDLGEQTLT